MSRKDEYVNSLLNAISGKERKNISGAISKAVESTVAILNRQEISDELTNKIDKELLAKLILLLNKEKIPATAYYGIFKLLDVYGVVIKDSQRNIVKKIGVSLMYVNKIVKILRNIGVKVEATAGAGGLTIIDFTTILNK